MGSPEGECPLAGGSWGGSPWIHQAAPAECMDTPPAAGGWPPPDPAKWRTPLWGPGIAPRVSLFYCRAVTAS